MVSPEPQGLQSTLSEADLVQNGLTGVGIFSRSAARLRARFPGREAPFAPKVEPIEIHLSIPDGPLLPIDDLIASHGGSCGPTGGTPWSMAVTRAIRGFGNGWPTTTVARGPRRSRRTTSCLPLAVGGVGECVRRVHRPGRCHHPGTANLFGEHSNPRRLRSVSS